VDAPGEERSHPLQAALTLELAPATAPNALEVLPHDLLEEIRDAAPFGPRCLLEARLQRERQPPNADRGLARHALQGSAAILSRSRGATGARALWFLGLIITCSPDIVSPPARDGLRP